MQFGKLTLKRCRHGWMLFNGPSGPFIGRCFELYGEFSEGEVDLMCKLIEPGDTVIDVGANIGSFTVPLANRVGAAGRVYAVESHAETFQVLCANLALNGLSNVKPVNAFVTADPHTSTDGDWGRHGYVSAVWAPPFIPIDALDVPACRLIKIDTDGRELGVIQSAEQTISRFRPVIYFENEKRALSPPLLSHVRDLGYDMHWHITPLTRAGNFFGHADLLHGGKRLVSPMVVATPKERPMMFPLMRKVADVSEWWEDVHRRPA